MSFLKSITNFTLPPVSSRQRFANIQNIVLCGTGCLVCASILIALNHNVFEPTYTPEIRRLINTEQPHLSFHPQEPQSNGSSSNHLDFVIGGFPKCGTTSLLYAFADHPNTDIGKVETCVIMNPFITDEVALNRMQKAVGTLADSPSTKRGIKCPTGISNFRSLERLQSFAPNTLLIIGVRHPVFFLASYYNYRITEIYDKYLNDTIPPIESLLGMNEWKGVSTDQARFELFLMQLGKTNFTNDELSELLLDRPHMGIKPNTFKVFLYALDQLQDTNPARSLKFRLDLQMFLGLREPIPPFGHENLNHFVGKLAHPETVDLCDSKYDEFRSFLVRQGKWTGHWIRKNFIKSGDVVVSNHQHFVDITKQWGTDPCAAMAPRPGLMKLLKQTDMNALATNFSSAMPPGEETE